MPWGARLRPWRGRAFGRALLCLALASVSAAAQRAGAAAPSPATDPKATEGQRQGAADEEVAAALRTLELARAAHGPRHPQTLASMSGLAGLYWARGRYAEAEPLTREALRLSREALGSRHPDTLGSVGNLALLYQTQGRLYQAQGRHGEAEPLLREALQLRHEALGSRHPDTLLSMDNLAALYQAQGRYGEAEPLLREVLQLLRETLGPRHPNTLASMSNLAELYRAQGRHGEAEPLTREALQLSREVLGPRHPNMLASMSNLAVLYQAQGRYGEAEPLLREALQLLRETLGPRHPNTLASMSNLALLYQAQGRYGEAEPLTREALQLLRETLGPRHPDTLTSMSNLALLYQAQGRYGEAEPLTREALQLLREVLGPRHPSTLLSMNNLAFLYQAQGRYGEAEPLYREALQLGREALGPRHPSTLVSMNNLAFLYRAQGRHGEAEPLYLEALRLSRDVLGPRHPSTLVSMNNLAALYQEQGRHGEAEPLFREALRLSRDVLGPRHPSTLVSMSNLAELYRAQGRHGEAEPLLREALRLSRDVLGPRHPSTLVSMSNLAELYRAQGRHGEAEPLSREALRLSREALGPRHPDTLASMNNLAALYQAQGRHGEAEPLLREALKGMQAALGTAHPNTLLFQLNGALNLVALGRVADAVQQLAAMQAPILTRLGAELSTTEAPRARGNLVASQASYQDVVLSLALSPKAGSDAASLAASAVLRLKGLRAGEDAYLAHIARQSRDPEARAIAAELANMHGQLAALFHGEGKAAEIAALTARMQAQEVALAQVSREYGQQLQARSLGLSDLRARLAPRAALLELREYRPFDFRTGSPGPWRWAGALLRVDGLRVVDLGPAEPTAQAAQALLDDLGSPAGRQAAAALHEQLLGPFKAELAGLDRLHVAPDGLLHLVPFAALLGPDGRRLAERLDVRLLQTGRDLLRPDPDPADAASGLLALGGIDFDAAEARQAASAAEPAPMASGVSVAELRSRTAAAIQSFPALPGTAEEVRGIAALYRGAHPGEPVTVWQGAAASEARLRGIEQPPRVLHLATHGFYRPAGAPSDRPLLLSGVALAGANRALRDTGQDGILYAIEAQDLNLEGTELVVLSACETGQGQVDYGEGVSGLVQALRTAGARHVLVTLRPVSDEGAASFMESFYRHWLGQARSNPAAAFQAAQREAIRAAPGSPAGGDPTWAQFVLVGK